MRAVDTNILTRYFRQDDIARCLTTLLNLPNVLIEDEQAMNLALEARGWARGQARKPRR